MQAIPKMPFHVTHSIDLCMKIPPHRKAKRLVTWHKDYIIWTSSPLLRTTKPCFLSDALIPKTSPPSILTQCFTTEKGL